MKLATLFFLTFLSVSFGRSQSTERKISFTVDWVFVNIIEGYDHQSKMLIYIDGDLVKESSITRQSKQNSLEIFVPKGRHDIEIVSYALYNGEWQKHTKCNEFSVDAFYKDKLGFRNKPRQLWMLFDINTEEALINLK